MGFLKDIFDELDLKMPFKDVKEISYDWSKKQQNVIDCSSEKIIVSGGYGSGKSFCSFYKFLIELKRRGGYGIATGFSYNTINKLLLLTFEKLNIDYQFDSRKSMFKTDFGSFFLYGMDTIRSKARIRSLNLSCWYADEVTIQDKEACIEVMARLRSIDNPFWIWSTNPDSPTHWVYEYILKGIPHFSFKTADNKHLPDNYISNLGYDEDSNDYKRMIEGVWITPDFMPFKNLYYSDYEIAGEIIAVIDPSLQGVDYTAIAYGCMYNNEIVVSGAIFKLDYIKSLENARFMSILKKATYVYYENNIAGNILSDILYNKYGIFSEGFRSIQNKDRKIRSICAYVNSGRLKFEKKTDYNFLEQILNYNEKAKYDDAPDVLAMLVNKMQEYYNV